MDGHRSVAGAIKDYLARERISREQFAFKTKLGKSTVDKLLTGLFSDKTLSVVEKHTGIQVADYASMIDERALFLGQWGLKPARGKDGPSYEELVETEGRPRMRALLDRVQTDGLLEAGVVYGYFPAVSNGDDLIVLDEDGNENRPEAARIISRPHYVGADYEVIANSMTGTFEYGKGNRRSLPDFNVFFRYFATYPYYSDAVWYLTQMRRWGQIAEGKDDAWYAETAKSVYRPDIYLEAAEELIAEGKASREDFPFDTDGFKEPTDAFIDGVEYDGRKPNDYLQMLAIGLKGTQRIDGATVTN